MKSNLKFLQVIVLIFIITLIVDAFGKLSPIVHYLFDTNSALTIKEVVFPSQWSNLSIIIYLIFGTILILFLAYLASIFRKVIASFSKNNYFSDETAKQLSKVGKGLIIYGCGIFILKLILNSFSMEFSSYSIGFTFGKSIAKSLPIFIFSSFALLIASIIKKGNILQQENDLTV